jgi:hypothetical protein
MNKLILDEWTYAGNNRTEQISATTNKLSTYFLKRSYCIRTNIQSINSPRALRLSHTHNKTTTTILSPCGLAKFEDISSGFALQALHNSLQRETARGTAHYHLAMINVNPDDVKPDPVYKRCWRSAQASAGNSRPSLPIPPNNKS